MNNDSNIDKMTLDELQEYNQALMAQRATLKALKKQVDARITKLTAVAEAEEKLASMSDAEKAALAQVISAEGITSKEIVNELA